jgi:ketosteroid isomerase-like protein
LSDNAEIVRKANDAYMRGAFGEAIRWMDPEIEWDMTNVDVPDAAVYRGYDGLIDFENSWDESWESVEIEPLEYIEVGDRVIVVLRQTGKGKLSGVEVEQHFAQLWTLRAGRLFRMVMYPDREAALEAVEKTERARR